MAASWICDLIAQVSQLPDRDETGSRASVGRTKGTNWLILTKLRAHTSTFLEFKVRELSPFLVEDETLIRMMMAQMLEELGHRVIAEAGSVREALSLADTADFDLAPLDVNQLARASRLSR
jgi:hypothetical protein